MRKTLSRILLVAPASVNDETLQDILTSHGFELIKASSLVAAIQKITECEPDLIICNHNFSDQTGFTIFQSLQTILTIKEIPFMLFMDTFDKNEVMIGLEMGIDNFIIKPYDKNALVKKINRYISRNSKQNILNTERFRLYFNKSPYAKFITESKRLISVNEAFLKIAGMSAPSGAMPDINEVFDFSENEANELEFRKCMSGISEYAVFKSVPLHQKKTPRFDIHMVYSDYFGKNIFTGEIISLQENRFPDFYNYPDSRHETNSNGLKPQVLLTQREREVLGLSAQGLSIKQIADQLKVSARTVEKHRANIMEKTESSNIIEAIYFLQE